MLAATARCDLLLPAPSVLAATARCDLPPPAPSGFSVQGGGQAIIDPGGGCGRGATCVDYERCGTTTNRTGARSGSNALLSFLCFLSFFLSLLSDGGAKKAKKEKKKNQERMLPLLKARVRLANRGSCNCRLEVATVTT